jgi:hypothetical protein
MADEKAMETARRMRDAYAKRYEVESGRMPQARCYGLADALDRFAEDSGLNGFWAADVAEALRDLPEADRA